MDTQEEPVIDDTPQAPETLYGTFEYQSGAKYIGEYSFFEGVKKRHGVGKYTHSGTGINPVHASSFRQPTLSKAVSATSTLKPSSMAASRKLLGSETNDGNITEEYDGDWSEDNIHGYGVYKYKNGDVYDGYWVNGLYCGQGTYTFASGAKYSGEWANNRMNGIITFTEENGTEMTGIFINGSFDSSIQKQLTTERVVAEKVREVSAQAQSFLASARGIFDAEEATWKDAVVQLLGYMHPDEVLPHVTEPFVRYEAFKLDVWANILRTLPEGNVSVLKSAAEATILASDRIASVQLNGPGQIVEISQETEESQTKAVIINIADDQWCILSIEHEVLQQEEESS